ncbi:MAG: 4Fe-4S dicluster domain-containing protein [Bacteroidales bacterium]|nr:4Fe-4S dicluster domain-containing protein [Bacteroidales bacterium]
MKIDRRLFFKVLGATGASVALGTSLKAAPRKQEEKEVEFYGVLYDSTRCVGCQTCEFSCAEAHGLPEPSGAPEAGVIRKINEKNRTVVNVYKTSRGDVFVKTQCMHCSQPACVAACLTQAMQKTKEGSVIWRGEKCMGCRYCMVSCPFDVPKFEYHSANPVIQKCTMCYDRLKEGKIPACVENCPNQALMFGTRRELIKEGHKRIVENPDQYVDYIYGEQEAGGTAFLYLSPVPFHELGFNTHIQKTSYPELSKGFLYSVPSIFVLLPPILLGIYDATKNKNKEEENE